MNAPYSPSSARRPRLWFVNILAAMVILSLGIAPDALIMTARSAYVKGVADDGSAASSNFQTNLGSRYETFYPCFVHTTGADPTFQYKSQLPACLGLTVVALLINFVAGIGSRGRLTADGRLGLRILLIMAVIFGLTTTALFIVGLRLHSAAASHCDNCASGFANKQQRTLDQIITDCYPGIPSGLGIAAALLGSAAQFMYLAVALRSGNAGSVLPQTVEMGGAGAWTRVEYTSPLGLQAKSAANSDHAKRMARIRADLASNAGYSQSRGQYGQRTYDSSPAY
jgi:hypothetical protein